MALLAVLAVAVVVALLGGDPPGSASAAALPVLVLLVAGAERAQVRYRVGRDVDGINLLEAALAPLLFAYPPAQAVLAVAAAQTLAAVLARNEPVKSAFNVAQWSLATACGSAVVLAVGGAGAGPRSLLGVLAALVVVALVNNTAFAGVLAVSRGGAVLRRLRPLLVPAWGAGLALNAAVGLLYVVAFAQTPLAVVLFAAPLLVLHLAYRGQAAAHAERGLVSGLHGAGQALASPLDARDAVDPWLREVARTFGARVVLLALPDADGSVRVHRCEDDVVRPGGDDGLLAALGPLTGPVRLPADAPVLRLAGARDGLAAPLREDDATAGALLVLDVSGLEGARTSELPVLAAVAREAAAAFGKGRLLADVLEERRKLDELVSTTSDGILSLDRHGVVRSWNPALERLTGLSAAAVVGVPGALDLLGLRDPQGRTVRVAAWHAEDRPAELLLDGPAGARRVACSYSLAPGSDTLVVVARDVTPAEEVAELRRQFARLVEAEAAQRVVVEHLQRAVMPPLPDLAGAELGVRYVASDPSEPTGGDLYDCQVLPDGTVHLAVVDVLGHGVQATQHALSVAHTLRTVVLDGTPLEDVVRRADLLLSRQDPDLVATVVLARYTPSTGLLRLAGGGHPPPLVVHADGTAVQVEVEGGAVGWPLAGSDGVAEVTLAPGDALVLYTDGLVEARKDILEGLAALGELAGSLVALAAEPFAQALVDDALRGADRRDDTLALVLRRAALPGPDDGVAVGRWQLTADPAEAGAVRREVASWAGRRGLPADEVATVVGELLANAVVAARSTVAVVGRTETRDDGVRLHLEVCDDGAGFEAVAAAPRAVDECGRGLGIVRALASDVQVRSTSGGTTVAVVLRA